MQVAKMAGMKTYTHIIHSGMPIKAWFFCILLSGVSLAFTSPANASVLQQELHEIQIDFSFDTQSVADKSVTGYHLYKDGVLVCQAGPVEPQSFSCDIYSDVGTFDFTISAVYDDLSESPQSAPFAFAIENTPVEEESTPIVHSSCSQTSGSKTFTFTRDGEADPATQAYRFYLNEQFLCENVEPQATSVSMNANLQGEEMRFSMASVDYTGKESFRSNILTFDPTEFPEVYGSKLLNFSWNYPSERASGFKVYHNNNLLCETADSSAKQISCQANLNSSNTFNISAVLPDGSETSLSNPIIYNTSSNEPETMLLAANIVVDGPTSGVAPYSLTFDGTASTGSIANYKWNLGDGNTTGGPVAQHVFQTPGTYTTTLMVTDSSGAKAQTTIDIKVTEPVSPIVYEPPTAVISSSTAIGQAPFAIAFDGSASTTLQAPFTSYTWDFGDGSNAQGPSVSHTYKYAGSYIARLTVTDSVGKTATTTTPVLITKSEDDVFNQSPHAFITLSEKSGAEPLTITFSAASSSDPDGTITECLWNFGDGSTANGDSVKHTFYEPADYTVSLKVTDNDGKTDTTSVLISVTAQEDEPFSYEIGELEINHEWSMVTFAQKFNDPVIIGGPPSYNGEQPTTTRIKDISTEGFAIRSQEWDYLDGRHSKEMLSFLAVEKGSFTLPDGTMIEAGTFTATTSFQEVNLRNRYTTPPVILTQVISENGKGAIAGRVEEVSGSSFRYKLQGQETNKTGHTSETVAYIAWQQGTGELSTTLQYESGVTANAITDQWSTVTFQTEMSSMPFFLAAMQTEDGGDTAVLRMQNISNTSVQVKVEEEQSMDNETVHTTEAVGYLVFAQTPQEQSPAEKQLSFTWDFDVAQEQTILGFRIYNNGMMICETNDPSVRRLECIAALDTTNDFSIRTVGSADTEGDSSNTINYTP